MSSANILRLLAQFFVIPILSRLLSPEDYGIAAIAMPIIVLTMVFTDAGLGRSLVRTPVGEKEIWSTCFWLSVFLGLLLALLVIVLAPAAATLFNEPRLQPIVMALSVVIFVQSVSTVPGAAMQQKHKFKAIAGIEVVSLFLGIIAAVAIALAGGGAWALIGQQIVFYVVRVAMTFWQSPFYPLMVFDLKMVREHLLFGRDIIGVGLVQFLSRSVDNLVIGKVLGEALVGIYSMAFQFARLPVMLVSGPLQYVIYAQLIELKTNATAIRPIFLLLNRCLAIVVFPAMAMVAVAHEPLFRVFLSAKWAHSGELFMIAAAASALQAVTSLGGTILILMGRTDRQFRASAEFVALWIIGLLVAVRFGLEWTAIAYNVVVFIYTPRQLLLLLPLIHCSMTAYLRTLLIPALISLISAATYCLLNYLFAPGELPLIFISALLAALAFGISALLQGRLLKEEVALCRKLLHA